MEFYFFFFVGSFTLGTCRFSGIEALFNPRETELSSELFNMPFMAIERDKKKLIEFACSISQTDV